MTDKEKIEELQIRVQALEEFIRGTFPAFRQLQIPFEYKPITIKKETAKKEIKKVKKNRWDDSFSLIK